MLPVCFATEISTITDANGNLIKTSDSDLRREYNGLNQLARIWNDTSNKLYQEYIYDPVEERVAVKKTYDVNGALKETVYYFDKDYVRVVNSSGTYDTEYIYLEGQLIAQIRNDSSIQYVHTDHLGSSTVITDQSGAVLENTSYTPYGEVLEGGSASRYQYEGKEYDSKTGSYDFHFRGYNPEWAMFTQPDTLIQNVYDPQSLNRYMFERGNPYKNTDPTGHSELIFHFSDDFTFLLPFLLDSLPLVIIGLGLYTMSKNQKYSPKELFSTLTSPMGGKGPMELLADSFADAFVQLSEAQNMIDRGEALCYLSRVNNDGSISPSPLPNTGPFTPSLMPPGYSPNLGYMIQSLESDLANKGIGRQSSGEGLSWDGELGSQKNKDYRGIPDKNKGYHDEENQQSVYTPNGPIFGK